MKTILISLLAMMGAAASASAATLSVSSDQSIYNSVGDIVTLTVIGDAEGAASMAAFARVTFGGSATLHYVSGNQTPQTSFNILPWTNGALSGDSTGANAMNWLAGLTPRVPDTLFVSTVVLTIASGGVAHIGFDTGPSPTQLDFFGLTDGTGTSFTVTPEPTTAGLLGLGLLGLGVARRRRRG